MFFGRKYRHFFIMCFIFIFINTILVVFTQKKKNYEFNILLMNFILFLVKWSLVTTLVPVDVGKLPNHVNFVCIFRFSYSDFIIIIARITIE